MRKKKVCDENCFDCKFTDCINDEVPPEKRYTSQTYAYRREHGLCTRCQAPAPDGKSLCTDCAARNNLNIRRKYYTEDGRGKTLAYIKARRQRRIAKGVCTYCGGALDESGWKNCSRCRAYYREQQRKWLLKKTLPKQGSSRLGFIDVP